MSKFISNSTNPDFNNKAKNILCLPPLKVQFIVSYKYLNPKYKAYNNICSWVWHTLSEFLKLKMRRFHLMHLKFITFKFLKCKLIKS